VTEDCFALGTLSNFENLSWKSALFWGRGTSRWIISKLQVLSDCSRSSHHPPPNILVAFHCTPKQSKDIGSERAIESSSSLIGLLFPSSKMDYLMRFARKSEIDAIIYRFSVFAFSA
jgi:hypothetical protein